MQATPETSDVEIEWLPEWAFRRHLGGADQRVCGVCHDRTKHIFDSQGNAIWWAIFWPTACKLLIFWCARADSNSRPSGS